MSSYITSIQRGSRIFPENWENITIETAPNVFVPAKTKIKIQNYYVLIVSIYKNTIIDNETILKTAKYYMNLYNASTVQIVFYKWETYLGNVMALVSISKKDNAWRIYTAFNSDSKQKILSKLVGFNINPEDLIDAYNENEFAADENFKDQTFLLVGKCSGVRKDFNGKVYVDIYTNNNTKSMYIYPEQQRSQELYKLKKDQFILFHVKIDNYFNYHINMNGEISFIFDKNMENYNFYDAIDYYIDKVYDKSIDFTPNEKDDNEKDNVDMETFLGLKNTKKTINYENTSSNAENGDEHNEPRSYDTEPQQDQPAKPKSLFSILLLVINFLLTLIYKGIFFIMKILISIIKFLYKCFTR